MSGLLMRDTFLHVKMPIAMKLAIQKKVELIFLVTSYSKSFS